MEPFNLEQYKSGREVVYRNGEKPHDIAIGKLHVYTTSIDGYNWTHSLTGELHNGGQNCELDLFHPDREEWVNLWEDAKGIFGFIGYKYNSMDEAQRDISIKDGHFIGTYKLVKG